MQVAFISNWWSISKNKARRLDKAEGNVAFSRILLWMNARMIYFFTIFFFFYSTTFFIKNNPFQRGSFNQNLYIKNKIPSFFIFIQLI